VNRLEHAIEIVKDIIVREAQNVIPLCGERGRTSIVASNLAVRCVSLAIDFDDYPRLEARKVGDEATENNLATELEVRHLLTPKALPQTALGACRVASKASRNIS
jgi:hypothetical protein